MAIAAFSNGRTPMATFLYNLTASDFSGNKVVTVQQGLYYLLNASKTAERSGPDVSITITGDATIIEEKNDWGTEYVCRSRIVKVNSGTATVTFYCRGANRVACTFQIIQIK